MQAHPLKLQDEAGNVTDLISFYSLPSTVVRHPVHKKIEAAYSFYNVSNTHSLKEILNDALILARNVRQNNFHLLISRNLHI